MSTFDTTKIALKDILGQITDGRVQLPDFQRGWYGMMSMSGLCWSVLPVLFPLVRLCCWRLGEKFASRCVQLKM